MSSAVTILNIAIVVVLLWRDWGRRRVTTFGLLRPLVLFAVVVPFVAPGWDLSGGGLWLVSLAVVLGVILGALPTVFMRVTADPTGQGWSEAGYAYAVGWIVVSALRQLFIYGCQHWYTHALGVFLFDHHISVNAFADSIMFLTLATIVGNRATIFVRSRRAAGRDPQTAPALA